MKEEVTVGNNFIDESAEKIIGSVWAFFNFSRCEELERIFKIVKGGKARTPFLLFT